MKIQQAAEYDGNDWWTWSVHLEGTVAELSKVTAVTYYLHPTFVEPVVKVTSRKTKFRLESGGWGGFTIGAHLHGKDGKLVAKLVHELELEYPAQPRGPKKTPPRKTAPSKTAGNPAARGAAPKIFISHAATDADLADIVKQALKEQGHQLLGSQDLKAGRLWKAGMSEILDESLGLVAIVSDPPSRSVEAEVDEALRRGKPVMAVLMGDTVPTGDLASVRFLRLKADVDAAELGTRVANAATKAFSKAKAPSKPVF